MIKVLYGGGFDIFHWMHLESIRRAKSEGDYIVVMVNSDRLIQEYKGKSPFFNETERADIIRNLRFVDEVIIKDTFSDVQIIKDHNIDVFVVCGDWSEEKKPELELMKARGGRSVLIPYLRTESMPDLKKKFNELMELKGKVLCEKCHNEM